MAKIIQVDGTERELLPANGKSFTLKEMQGVVGGLIELAFTNDGRIMWINEEGKLKGLWINKKATDLYIHNDRDIIRGPVLVGHEKEFAYDEEI